MPLRPISDESFMKINEVGASFCTGGFSARSTSVGGSVEVSNREQQLPFNPQQKTQDERFSDFSILRGNSSGDKPGGMSSASKHRFEDYSNVAHSKLFGDGSSGGIGLPNGSPQVTNSQLRCFLPVDLILSNLFLSRLRTYQNFSLAGSGVLSNPFESGKRISNSDLANFKEDPFRSRDSNPFGGFQGSGDPFAKISPVPARPCTDMNSNKNPVTPTEHVGEQQRSIEDPPRLISLGGNCVEDEEFGAVNPHELIDNDEKQFEEENRFNQTGNGGGDAVRGVGVTDLSGISPGGSSRPVRGEANESKMSVFPTDDPLSRSHYFQMNSSR